MPVSSPPDTLVTLHLAPASDFSIEQLTNAYNQTRVDYVVPMPMNASRLAEYIQMYAVDLERSFVALAEGEMLGLGMLGVRPGRSWITRLGVLPTKRRTGAGRAIVEKMLTLSEAAGLAYTQLEVIKNNTPAYELFLHIGFKPTREFLVLRRPPGPSTVPALGTIRDLNRDEALSHVRRIHEAAMAGAMLDYRRQSWITEPASLAATEAVQGLEVSLPNGAQGVLVFEVEKLRQFPKLLSHLVMCTDASEAQALGQALLAHLYGRYPRLDTQAENIAADDPHLPAFFALGFIESFRRIEMFRPCPASVVGHIT